MVKFLKFGAVISRGLLEPPSFARIKSLGFDGVEVFLWQLKADEKDAVVRRLRDLSRDYGLRISDIGGGPSLVDMGIQAKAEESIERGREFLSIARSLDSPISLMPSFRAPPEVKREEILERAAQNLRKLDRFAQMEEVDIVIEPLNRYETNLLRTMEETVKFIEGLGTERVRLMADLYHMNIEEASLPFALRRTGGLLDHVHVSENHGGLPGTGTIPYGEVFRILKSMGYKGFVSIEFHGYQGDIFEGYGKALSYLRLLDAIL
ncbi:MAG: sugar phosphate isomerase/epimerase family protein [Candidatus Bathyarchaeia archaeon]